MWFTTQCQGQDIPSCHRLKLLGESYLSKVEGSYQCTIPAYNFLKSWRKHMIKLLNINELPCISWPTTAPACLLIAHCYCRGEHEGITIFTEGWRDSFHLHLLQTNGTHTEPATATQLTCGKSWNCGHGKSAVRFIRAAHALLKWRVRYQYGRKRTSKYLLTSKRYPSTVRVTATVTHWALLWLCLYSGSVPKFFLHPKSLYLTLKEFVSHQNSFAWSPCSWQGDEEIVCRSVQEHLRQMSQSGPSYSVSSIDLLLNNIFLRLCTQTSFVGYWEPFKSQFCYHTIPMMGRNNIHWKHDLILFPELSDLYEFYTFPFNSSSSYMKAWILQIPFTFCTLLYAASLSALCSCLFPGAMDLRSTKEPWNGRGMVSPDRQFWGPVSSSF